MWLYFRFPLSRRLVEETFATTKTGAVDAGFSIRWRFARIYLGLLAIRNLFVPPHQKHTALATHIHRIRAMAQ